MFVAVEGEKSRQVDVVSVVPQGTVLGPPLFLCHINDLPDRLTSHIRLFADDCLLYRAANTPVDHQRLQQDLDNLQKWAQECGMKFNAQKCHALSSRNKSFHFYSIDDHTLQQLQNNPYLGITFSDDLKCKTHFNNICKKANSGLVYLCRNMYNCPKSCRKNASIALVRSKLEYGSIIWDPYTKSEIDQPEKIQRSAARFITNDYKS